MKTGPTDKILRTLLILVLLVLVFPLSAEAGPDNSKREPAIERRTETDVQVKESRQIRLITGDLVKVTIMSDGKRNFSISPADPGKLGQRFLTFDQAGNTYIIPDGIDLEKLDVELFNVDYLVDEEYDKVPALPLLVSYQSTLSTTEVQSFQSRVQALSQETKPLPSVSALAARLAYDNIAASYQKMVAQPEVKKIWLNKKVHADLADSVPLVGAPSWWTAGYSGNGTRIAILDTGIDATHSSLDDLDDSANTTDPKVVVNVNFSSDNDTADRHGHGTHVSGIAAGTVGAPQAKSGEYAWFSGAANNLNNTLTRSFDLSSVNSTSIRFWTKYDMEIGYDYGYLKVSNDNGVSWSTLATYNGLSANLSGFTQVSYNLSSNFTGRIIQVRFQYVTDSIVAKMGWYVDDIEVPGISFIDDAESTSGNWTASGWTRNRMVGSYGVAPGAKLWNVKVLNQWGYGYWDQIINGVNFASLGTDGIPRTGDEADIISMSLGGGATDGTDPVSLAVNMAVDRGVTVVVAAGNSGPNPRTVSSPGVAEKVITVGATAKDDTIASFSSRGPTIDIRLKPDIVAPGVSIVSARQGGGSISMSGTSMATPHVAGAAALLRQRYGDNVTPQFIKDALMYTAKDLSLPVYQQGAGRLNLAYSSWPKVGVTPASRSLGRFSNETAASANFTFFNADNVSHQVMLTANVTRVLDNASANVVLSPASFTIPASGNVSVNVTANLTALPTGAFSGVIKATVDNTTSIHAILGFSKLRQVTLLKTDVTGALAKNHPVWVFMSSPGEELFIDWKFTDLSGNLTFYVPDGMYNVLSPNWGNAVNQTDIWTISENVTVTGDMTINLDERNTLGITFNPNKPEKFIPSARSTTLYYSTNQTVYGFRNSWWYPQSFAARVSPFRKFDAGFVYNTYPEADFLRDGPGLVNADEWLNLLYSVDNITSNTTFVADYPNLVRRTTRYGVALEGEKAYLYQYVSDNVSWWSTGFGYAMDAPRTRTEWLSPSPAYYVTYYEKAVYETGNLWGFINGFQGASGNYTRLIGIHPFTSGLYLYIWSDYYGTGQHRMYIYGPISRDQSGNGYYNYGASVSGHLKITNNTTGSILERDIRDNFSQPIDFNGTANLTVEVWGETPLKLSPTNYTRLSFTANVSRDYRPPDIYTSVDRLNNHGVVPAGADIIARVKVYDASSISSVQLSYALGDSTNSSSANWTDAGAPTLSAGEYVFNLGALQGTFVSLRVTAIDQYGNRITRLDDRAFRVGLPGLLVSVNAPPLVIPSVNFTATVNISNVASLDAANYDVVFDPAVLSLVDVTAGSINGTAVPVDLWNQRSAGRYTIVQNVPGLAGATGNGTLSTLRFQVLGGYGATSGIGLENGVLSDNQSQAIMAAWIGAQVTATGRTGDATGDNLIDARDITRVERIIARLDPPVPGADANRDNNINAVDITKVERFIGGLDIPGAAVPEVEWTRTFGGALYEFGWTVQQTADGGYIIGGSTNSTGSGLSDAYLVKTDASGNAVWTRTFGGGGDDRSYGVQQTSDGGYIISGYTGSSGAGSIDAYLVKTDFSGNAVWSKTFGGASVDMAYNVRQTLDGSYVFAGYSYSSTAGGNADAYLVKTDASGNTIWSKTIGGAQYDFGRQFRATSDGGYIIVGSTNSTGAGFNDVYLVKTDSLGNVAWDKPFGGAALDDGWSVRQTADGGYIVAGTTASSGAGGLDVYLVKTDSSGNLVWSKTFGGTSTDVGYSVQVTADGGYIVAGYTLSSGAGLSDVYVIKTDSAGNLVWSKTFGGTSDDLGYSVQLTSDGGYIITGRTNSFGAGSGDVYLIKLK